MNIPDELLAAYLDGELQGAERARVEQAIQHDKRLAKRLAQQRTLRARSLGTLDATHQQPLPQRMAHSGRSVAATGSAQIIDLARVRAERKRRSERSRTALSRRIAVAAGLAAGLLLGIVIGRFAPSGALTQYRDGALYAGGALAEALNGQLASSPLIGSAVRMGISFKSRSGSYCRTFLVRDTRTLSGLACRDQDQWRLWTLDATEPRSAAGRESHPSASLPAVVMQAVNERISGAPLDAQAELKARRGGWR